jgi:PKD repeat protein
LKFSSTVFTGYPKNAYQPQVTNPEMVAKRHFPQPFALFPQSLLGLALKPYLCGDLYIKPMKRILLALFLSLSVAAEAQNYMCYSPYTTTATSGTLYDSGGPSYSYVSYENCAFLISNNACPGNITLSFSYFSTESYYDVLTVYNGSTTSAPILGSYSGTGLPPNMVATSGHMLITWYSDGSANYNGFTANWNISNGNCAPVANYSTVVSSCQGKVNFTDMSQYVPTSWLWNFGDGNASTLKNPVHTYTTAGNFPVTLIATNAYGSSTITKSVNVNPIVFEIGYNGAPIANSPMSFTTDYTSGTVYTWTFGDGGSAGTANAIHSYTAMGTYKPGLTVATGSCVTTRTMDLVISDQVGIQETSDAIAAVISPNPNQGSAVLQLGIATSGNVLVEVTNALGQVLRPLHNEYLTAGVHEISINDLPSGVHFVNITVNGVTQSRKLITSR